MCLAAPLEIVRVMDDNKAEAGSGGASCVIDISITPGVAVGDCVIVHSGFAIERVDKAEAAKSIEMFNEIAELYNAARPDAGK